MMLIRTVSVVFASVFGLLLETQQISAAVIAFDETTLPAGPNVPLHVRVSGDEAVNLFELWVQIGDGGALNGGTDVAPTINSLDLITGTIFAGATQTDDANIGLIAGSHTSTFPTTANSLLATIYLNTSAVAGGSFTLRLTNVAENINTQHSQLLLTSNGNNTLASDISTTINVAAVPEPTTGLLVTAGFAALLLRRCRRITSSN